MAQTLTNRRQRLLFYLPMVLYFGFITVFLVTRFSLLYLLTQNPSFYNLYPTRHVNLVPFQTLRFYGSVQRLDVYGNILLFVPLGVYLHALAKNKSIPFSIVKALAAGLVVEGMQFLLATGSFDVDDLLLNLLGSIAGIALYHALYRGFQGNDGRSRSIIGVVSFGVIPFLFLTVLQDTLWLPRGQIVLLSLAVLGIFYAATAWLVRDEALWLKRLFPVSSALLCLAYFGFILPGVSPMAW